MAGLQEAQYEPGSDDKVLRDIPCLAYLWYSSRQISGTLAKNCALSPPKMVESKGLMCW